MNIHIAKMLGTMVGITLLGASANVFALGEADGQWFRLKYKTQNGLQVNTASGDTAKTKSVGTCYTQLIYTPNLVDPTLPGTYQGDVICEDSAGDFVSTAADIFLFELPGGVAAYETDNFVFYGNPFGHVVGGFSDQQLAIKLDRVGNFKKASLQSNGELVSSSLNPLDTNLILVGGYTVIGRSIPASKLPFIIP